MYPHMPPANPRKRAAPGASPVVQAPQMAQSYNTPNQVSNADFMRWSQAPENVSFPDPSFDLNNYGGNGLSQAPLDQSIPAPSTQLARRPINRQLVPTGQNTAYDNSTDPWGQFGDEYNSRGMNGSVEENDNIELLEEKAAVAKRDAQAKRKQIPPFVQKLSSFLDESKNTDLIRWSDRGDSFVVLDEDEFAKTLIPELFKHNNYASFVRQLNMYGFHKRVGLSDNSMKASERKNKSPSEYYNPYFKRGHPNLLWLINKPKSGGAKSKKGRGKNDERVDDSDDDGGEVEEVYGNNIPNPRAISAAPESGPLQRRDVAVLQNQLMEIQKQQATITSAISRLRKDHNQLYQQAMAFQTLHDRHENSINAILTFLATVYNRSLDGQGVSQNIAQMFANGIPHNDQPQSGNVVDIGDISNQQQQTPGNVSPHRRQQRLLMAPPTQGRAQTVTPSAAATPQSHTYAQTPQPGSIEELFDTSPADTTHNANIQNSPPRQQVPTRQMMSLIQNSNAQNPPTTNTMEFPEMLSHYENANGNSPLPADERNNMLHMIANMSSAASNSNNALVSPSPPPLNFNDLNFTGAELEELEKLQAEQARRLTDMKTQLEPLSPSGTIPGLESTNYFTGSDLGDPGNNLDLDQYLDSGAFYNGSSPIQADGGYKNYDFDQFGDGGAGGFGDAGTGIGLDSTTDIEHENGDAKVKLESPLSTPEDVDSGMGNTLDDANGGARGVGPRSPSKRRRKN